MTPGRLVRESFHSAALHHRRSYLVYTPPGYAQLAARGERFPVLYLLHGAPGSPKQFMDIAGAGVALDEGLKAGTLRPFLIAMPSGSDGSFRSETEWANTPHGRYESLVLETVRSVDARFKTLHGRRFRALGGNSEGGYASVNIALRHPKMFSIAEGWSGYYTERPTGVFARAAPAVLDANDPSFYVPRLTAQLHRYPLHAYLYKGKREPAKVRAQTAAFAVELRRAGGHVKYSVYDGGHDWRLWRRQTPHMLRFANKHFGARR